VVRRCLTDLGRDPDAAREVLDFYSLGPDCLWITFARHHLWWTFAEPEVLWLGGDGREHGERIRRAIGGWRSADQKGRPLRMDQLSTKLTQLASYRRTICKVRAQDYLLRRIRGIQEPIIAEANEARDSMLDITARAIASLHWADFETLVDIVFSRSGWFRVSALGGTQKTVDLELDQPTTDERALVQVKSKASQAVLDDYIARFDESGVYDRMFFICHSPTGKLSAGERPNVHVWAGREFAVMVLKLGLHDWVLEKIA
jgi:hypothetical protein